MNPTHSSQKPKQSELKPPQQDDFNTQIEQPLSSTTDILHLQRTIGNRATVQRLKKLPQGLMQRKLGTKLTHSAGFQVFGTSTYGQIKDGVAAYNLMPTSSSAELRLALAKLTTINGLIDTWTRAHMTKTKASESEKANELEALAAEITSESETLSLKHDAVVIKEREEQEAAALKTAADAVGYSALYATPEFTEASRKAGIRWLNTPVLNPVFRYHIIANQHEKTSLDAWDEIGRFAGGRAEAVALINKYQLRSTDVLNITGEGTALDKPGMIAFRARAGDVLGNPAAVVPADFFSQVHEGLSYSLNELFVSFKTTPAFKRITQP